MPLARATNGQLTVNAYPGDAKTLLAFDVVGNGVRERLAGFTIEVRPPGRAPYYADNNLRLAPSAAHAQLHSESPFASVNAPIQGFRWVHVPGLVHQAGTPALGVYVYVVTPRFFSEQDALLPVDSSTAVAVEVEVGPFAAGELKLGFTRGHLQSQAFVRRFGPSTTIRPHSDELFYDTGGVAGANVYGDTFTYAQQYEWLGSTARQRIFEMLDEVRADPGLTLDVFAHDLDEPDVCAALLELGAAGRVRIILDDSTAHHDTGEPSPEDRFEAVFAARAGHWALKRGTFPRRPHGDVLVVSDARGPRTVLTGSAALCVTGLYVNGDHVLVLDDRKVAAVHAEGFDRAWGFGPSSLVQEAIRIGAVPFGGNLAGGYGAATEARGVAETPGTVALYTSTRASRLPAPFDEVPRREGQLVHHEFAVLGFGGPDPVVYCGAHHPPAGSQNSDEWVPLAIRDTDVAAAFVIEALIIDEQYQFVDQLVERTGDPPAAVSTHADKRTLAVTAGWFLDTSEAWLGPYFDKRDRRCADRELFGRNGPTSSGGIGSRSGRLGLVATCQQVRAHDRGQLITVGDAELDEGAVDVPLDGARGQGQPVGDLPAVQTLDDQ